MLVDVIYLAWRFKCRNSRTHCSGLTHTLQCSISGLVECSLRSIVSDRRFLQFTLQVRHVNAGIVQTGFLDRRRCPMNEPDILAWINTLNDHQFAEFFYRLMKDRATIDRERHFVLAHASYDRAKWSLTLIALPDPELSMERGDHADICQAGECANCEHTIVSIVKRVLCPVCGCKAYCT